MFRVQAIYRYPVKGLGAEPLDGARATAGAGLEGDRAVALSNGRRPASDAWDGPGAFTALKNEISGAAYRTHTVDDGAITVTSPAGEAVTFDPRDAESRDRASDAFLRWFPAQGAHPRRLVRAPGGMFDSRKSGLSLINLATVRELGRIAGREVDPLRFRGNLYLDGLPAFAEFDLVGRRLRIGGVEGVVSKPIERCSATTVDPWTAESDLPVPSLLARELGHLHCGVYLQVDTGGAVSAGDAVEDRGDASDSPEVATSPAPRVMRVAQSSPLGEGMSEVILEDPREVTARLYAPGQHLRVHLGTPEGPVWRSYTITHVDGATVGLAVRHRGVGSRHLTAKAPGTAVLASGPYGQATVGPAQAGSSIALVSAGIGITPTLGMLAGLAGADAVPREIRVLQVEGREGPLTRRARGLAEALGRRGVEVWFTCHETAGRGRPSEGDLAAALDGTDEVFVCGPGAFMDATTRAAGCAGVAADRVHREVFASPLPLGAEGPTTLPEATITFGETPLPWRPASGTILDVLESGGVPVESSCRGGACGTCALSLRAGTVEYAVEPIAARRAGEVLACSAYPRGDVSLAYRQ